MARRPSLGWPARRAGPTTKEGSGGWRQSLGVPSTTVRYGDAGLPGRDRAPKYKYTARTHQSPRRLLSLCGVLLVASGCCKSDSGLTQEKGRRAVRARVGATGPANPIFSQKRAAAQQLSWPL